MKRVISIFILIVTSQVCLSQNILKDNSKFFDIAWGIGVGSIEKTSEHQTLPTLASVAVTVKGVVLGFGGLLIEGGESVGVKDVHVNSYTRVQNGKTVTVKSYNRARPGHGGGNNYKFIPKELYAGYWLPIISHNNFKLYTSNFIGVDFITGNEYFNQLEKTKFLYGGGFKFWFNGLGVDFKVLSSSITAGLSLTIPKF